MVAARPLHLCGLPIELSRESQAHVDAMIAAAETALAADRGGLTTSLALTVKSLSEEYSDITAGTEAMIDAAAAGGEDTVDLQFEAPLTMASAAETWLRLLEHLEDLASSGKFEFDPAPPQVAAYRKWVVEEIVDQLREGRAPVAFADAEAAAS